MLPGHLNVVRVLTEFGLDTIGGSRTLCYGIMAAVKGGRTKILHVLLGAQGEEKRKFWASSSCEEVCMLPLAVERGHLASVIVLLAAGARELDPDTIGKLPKEYIGRAGGKEGYDRAKEAAIGRVLEQGPAFRARSWTWPAKKSGSVDAAPPAGQPRKHACTARLLRPRSGHFLGRAVGR